MVYLTVKTGELFAASYDWHEKIEEVVRLKSREMAMTGKWLWQNTQRAIFIQTEIHSVCCPPMQVGPL